MAATVNNSAKVASKGGGTSVETASFSIGGANRGLLVLAYTGAGAPEACNGVKWQGSSGTSLTKIADSGIFATFGYATLWFLSAPAAATGTVYAQWTNTQDERMLICIAVEDMDQTTPYGTIAQGGNSTLTPSQNAAAVVGDLVLNFLALIDYRTDAKTLTPSGTSDQEIEGLEGGNLDGYEVAGGQHATAASTSQAMSWTVGGVGSCDTNWVYQFSLAVKGATGGGGGSSSLLANARKRINNLMRF